MKIKFLPSGKEIEGSSDKSLLQLATENQIEIKSVCKGIPNCCECRVKIIEGDQNIIPPNKAELNLIGTTHHIDSRRLACQVKCFGDVTVDISEQLERQETQSKKIRGFKSQRTLESKAVQDTMILTEKVDEKPVQHKNESLKSDGPKQGDQKSDSQRNEHHRNNHQKNHSKK